MKNSIPIACHSLFFLSFFLSFSSSSSFLCISFVVVVGGGEGGIKSRVITYDTGDVVKSNLKLRCAFDYLLTNVLSARFSYNHNCPRKVYTSLIFIHKATDWRENKALNRCLDMSL